MGIMYLILASCFFCTNFTIVTYLSSHFNYFQLILFRSLLGPILLLPFMYLYKIKIDFSRPGMLILRSVCGLIAMSCLYVALKVGFIGQVTLIFNFSVIWTFILAYFIFKDRPHRLSILMLPVIFAGL